VRSLSCRLAFFCALLPCTASAQVASVPTGKGGITRLNPHAHSSAAIQTAGTNGINYNGGPVLDTVTGSATKIYYIWYGDWTQDPGANNILTTFAQSIGGSPYFNINTTYYNASNQNVVNQAAYGGSFSVSQYPAGSSSYAKTLTDLDIYNIVASVHPTDTNGVYFVLTSPDVNESTGFCTQYCGWHDHGTINGLDIKYSFIGDAAAACPSACEQQSTGPNGGGGGDAMASIIAHELDEAVTDPDLNAWFDSGGEENADKCVWTFGTTHNAPNGALYNVTLGGLNYLIQQNWVNFNGGFCALSYAPSPDFSLSASPSTRVVNANGASTSYTINVGSLLGFSGSVALSVTSELPAGVTTSFTTNPVAGGSGSSTLNVTTTSATPVAIWILTVQGTSGGITHSVNVTLNIADFSISADPASQSVAQGKQATYTVTVSALDAFSGSVSLSASGLPAGATASFLPSTVNTSGTSFLTVSTVPSTPSGTSNVTITGVGPVTTHSAVVSLTLTGPLPDFTLSASPASRAVNPGTSTLPYTVTVNALNGFNSTVSFSVSGLPSGATPAFSVNPASGSTSLTVATTSTTPAGSFPLTITGASGALSHTTSVTLVVNVLGSISLSTTPSIISVTRPRGGNANSSTMITITRGGNFTGNVSLSLSGLPPQASASFSPNPASGSSSQLTITVSKKTAGGSFNLSITGTGGTGVASGAAGVLLNVN